MSHLSEKAGKKFSRSKNFSEKEETILLTLVRKYRDAVECKYSDANNRIKAEAWETITKEFNMVCGETHRDRPTLRNKYENIKKRSKTKFADDKKYVAGTGGGPSKPIVITGCDNVIGEILGEQLTGNGSEFDDDAAEGNIYNFFRSQLISYIYYRFRNNISQTGNSS